MIIDTRQDGGRTRDGAGVTAGSCAEDGGGVCRGESRTVSAAGAHIHAMDVHPVEESTTCLRGAGQIFRHKFGGQPEKALHIY